MSSKEVEWKQQKALFYKSHVVPLLLLEGLPGVVKQPYRIKLRHTVAEGSELVLYACFVVCDLLADACSIVGVLTLEGALALKLFVVLVVEFG